MAEYDLEQSFAPPDHLRLESLRNRLRGIVQQIARLNVVEAAGAGAGAADNGPEALLAQWHMETPPVGWNGYYFSVHRGFNPGIYFRADEAIDVVSNFRGSCMEKFKSFALAVRFYHQGPAGARQAIAPCTLNDLQEMERNGSFFFSYVGRVREIYPHVGGCASANIGISWPASAEVSQSEGG
jgi:hypothetical protein